MTAVFEGRVGAGIFPLTGLNPLGCRATRRRSEQASVGLVGAGYGSG